MESLPQGERAKPQAAAAVAQAPAAHAYLKNVMPQWSLGTIYRGMGEFMVIQITCLAAVLLWPEIALWLPRAV